MPLFQVKQDKMQTVVQTNFATERELQKLVEGNLKTIFNCQFVASEFVTGAQHAGRIDTLGLSEEGNPVIIEYKKVESSQLLNQSLYYLAWIHDHQGDFEIAVQKMLGTDVQVDWSAIRVICIAPGYKKYDLLAASVMGADIELWRYRYYQNGSIYFEEVGNVSTNDRVGSAESTKNPVMVEAGKKAAITRATGSYTFEEHLDKAKQETLRSLILTVDDYILGLDNAIERAPKKNYIAYKTTQNIVCIEVQRSVIKVFLKLSSSQVDSPPDSYRDVSSIGHFGTGDAEFTIKTEGEFENMHHLVEQSYLKVGG